MGLDQKTAKTYHLSKLLLAKFGHYVNNSLMFGIKMIKRTTKFLFAPKSQNKDIARREYILNILLFGCLFLTLIAFSINFVSYIISPSPDQGSPLVTGIILSIFILLFGLSKVGKIFTSSVGFIVILVVTGIYGLFYWGADLAAVLMLLALVITIAGILIDSKLVFFLTLLVSISILTSTYLDISGVYQPNDAWKTLPVKMVDSVVLVIMLILISVLAWLSNREIEKSLHRARRSEADLRRERDQLEIIVEERTRQLREAQLEKMAQMYRFVEIGKSASGLFHDLVNPLTLVSLNLDKLSKSHKAPGQKIEDTTVLLERALIGTKKLESFVQAARKQVQNQEVLVTFSIVEEIEQSIQMLQYRAKQLRIRLEFHPKSDVTLYGNVIKFSQVMTNLISNAIDAYEGKRQSDKVVQIDVIKERREIVLTVTDFGQGIDPKHLPYIFEPLFSTKRVDRGIGMGLSIAKDIIEKDFKGTISVDSELHVGTTFRVIIPIQK
jgi:signal transduction histidine kinase